MENFNPQTIDLSGINGGIRYKNGDIPDAEALNAPIEAAAWAQKVAKETQDLVHLAVGKDFDEIVDAIKTVVNNEAHPVGSLWFTDASDDPAELFGGSWEKIVDRVIIGAGGQYSIGSTGGSADAVIVSHTHYVGNNNVGGGVTFNSGVRLSSGYIDKANASFEGSPLATNSAGVSGAGKNMMPYRAFYIWYRYA